MLQKSTDAHTRTGCASGFVPIHRLQGLVGASLVLLSTLDYALLPFLMHHWHGVSMCIGGTVLQLV
jgi:hypothetical protein